MEALRLNGVRTAGGAEGEARKEGTGVLLPGPDGRKRECLVAVPAGMPRRRRELRGRVCKAGQGKGDS